MQRPISLLLCALGGEGGGVLSQWLVDVAREAGYAAQATSIPGVAQRTGATTYYIEVLPQPTQPSITVATGSTFSGSGLSFSVSVGQPDSLMQA